MEPVLGRKGFYNMLQREEVPMCLGLWRRKYDIEINSAHWNIIRNFKESRIKALCWKIIHNIYPTTYDYSICILFQIVKKNRATGPKKPCYSSVLQGPKEDDDDDF